MRALVVGLGVVAVVGVGVGGVTAARAGEALPGTTLAGTDLGGLDEAAVRETVERLAQTRTTGALPVTAADADGTISRSLATLDVDATVEAALEGGFVDRLLGRGQDIPVQLTVDKAGLTTQLAAIAKKVDRPADPGGFALDGTTVTPKPSLEGRTLDQDAAADTVTEALRANRPGPVALPVETSAPPTTPAQVEAVVAQARAALAGPYVLGDNQIVLQREEVAPLLSATPDLQLAVDVEALHDLVERKAERYEQPARSATFVPAGPGPTFDSKGDVSWTPRPAEVTVRPGTTGRAVDVDVATARLAELVKAGDRTSTRELPMQEVEPELTTEQAQAAGVRNLVGAFTTYFASGQPRAKNIRRIAELVDGTYIAPGETFSLNRAAGRRTAARGFVADGAIVDGELTDEVGGGVSQFATTLFNAAFFAGLPIPEYKPHSFYISRYPAGRESTVYFGAIDVKIRNDTAHGLYVDTRSTAGSVTVELYGDNGGRTVTSTSGPRRPRDDGGFRITVTRGISGGDGRGERRVFSTSYDPVPPGH